MQVHKLLKTIRGSNLLQSSVIRLSSFYLFKIIFTKYYRRVSDSVAGQLMKIEGVTDCLVHGSLVVHKVKPGISDIDIALILDDNFFSEPQKLQTIINHALEISNAYLIPIDIRCYASTQFFYVRRYGRLSTDRLYYSYKDKQILSEPSIPKEIHSASAVIAALKCLTNLSWYFQSQNDITSSLRLFRKFHGHITRLAQSIKEHLPHTTMPPIPSCSDWNTESRKKFLEEVWKLLPDIIIALDEWTSLVIPTDKISFMQTYIDASNEKNVLYSKLPPIQFITNNEPTTTLPGSVFFMTKSLLLKCLALRPRGISSLANTFFDDKKIAAIAILILSDLMRRPQMIFFPDHPSASTDAKLYYTIAEAIIQGKNIQLLSRDIELPDITWGKQVEMWTQKTPPLLDKLINFVDIN